MPIGSELKPISNKNSLYFKDFFTINIDLVCATLQIPPNVAMSKYDSNFSASRAALKDWELVLNVKRNDFSFQYYQVIYDFWLEVQILESKIQAPGYLFARLQGNNMVLEAYRTARFVGAQVPHIDPEKEVRAERLKLGEAGGAIPLTTGEASTERLDGGDFEENMKQMGDELAQSISLKIVAPVKTAAPAPTNQEP
jgi:capsid protein